MSLMTLPTLLVRGTKAAIYQTGLAIATAVGLPVTSWQTGDPTRSTFHFVSEILDNLEQSIVLFIGAGFLDTAQGDWLKLLAAQVYGYTAQEATYATTDVTLTNGGGGLYVIAAGDLTLKNTTSGATYHNINGGTLSPGPATLTLTFEADEPGSASNAGVGEIDDMVTTLLGVTVANAAVAVGLDEESPESIRDNARAKLGSLSPNGPRDAYDYVARNAALTGTTEITRTRTVGNTTTGIVNVYLASASGAVTAEARDAAEAAIVQWANPICFTPGVASATAVTVPVAYTLWAYSSIGQTTSEIEEAVEAALIDLFRTRPIGGDVIGSDPGRLYVSLLVAAIRATFPEHIFRVTISAPAADVDLAINEVASLGTVTATINLVADP